MAAPSADARRCIMVAVAYDALLDLWYDIQTVLRLLIILQSLLEQEFQGWRHWVVWWRREEYSHLGISTYYGGRQQFWREMRTLVLAGNEWTIHSLLRTNNITSLRITSRVERYYYCITYYIYSSSSTLISSHLSIH